MKKNKYIISCKKNKLTSNNNIIHLKNDNIYFKNSQQMTIKYGKVEIYPVNYIKKRRQKKPLATNSKA